MIIAEFYKKNGEINGFKIKGHAEFDDIGRDIVCASVSSAVQLIANMITESFSYDAKVSAEDNVVILKTSVSDDNVLQSIYNGFIMHLKLLSENFKKTITIKFTEV